MAKQYEPKRLRRFTRKACQDIHPRTLEIHPQIKDIYNRVAKDIASREGSSALKDHHAWVRAAERVLPSSLPRDVLVRSSREFFSLYMHQKSAAPVWKLDKYTALSLLATDPPADRITPEIINTYLVPPFPALYVELPKGIGLYTYEPGPKGPMEIELEGIYIVKGARGELVITTVNHCGPIGENTLVPDRNINSVVFGDEASLTQSELKRMMESYGGSRSVRHGSTSEFGLAINFLYALNAGYLSTQSKSSAPAKGRTKKARRGTPRGAPRGAKKVTHVSLSRKAVREVKDREASDTSAGRSRKTNFWVRGHWHGYWVSNPGDAPVLGQKMSPKGKRLYLIKKLIMAYAVGDPEKAGQPLYKSNPRRTSVATRARRSRKNPRSTGYVAAKIRAHKARRNGSARTNTRNPFDELTAAELARLYTTVYPGARMANIAESTRLPEIAIQALLEGYASYKYGGKQYRVGKKLEDRVRGFFLRQSLLRENYSLLQQQALILDPEKFSDDDVPSGRGQGPVVTTSGRKVPKLDPGQYVGGLRRYATKPNPKGKRRNNGRMRKNPEDYRRQLFALVMSGPEGTEQARELANALGILITEDGVPQDMRGVDFSGADLFAGYLDGVDLQGANLSNANLGEAYLRNADLRGADLSGANLYIVSLEGADLRRADLSNTNLDLASMHGANLSGADLSGANLNGAVLSNAILEGANLHSTYLTGADISSTDIRNANLSTANLRRANIIGANLSGADLSGANLEYANINRADLRGANLSGANFENAYIGGADLTGVKYNRKTVWPFEFTPPPSA